MRLASVVSSAWFAAASVAEQVVITDDVCSHTLLWRDDTCEVPNGSPQSTIAPERAADKEWAMMQSEWENTGDCHWENCVYHNARFGGGSILITDKANAEIVSSFPPPLGTPPIVPPFYKTEVLGKGMGLVANRTILKGETIMVRLALMVVKEQLHKDIDTGILDKLYDIAVGKLPAEKRREFDRLAGNDPRDKFDTNSFHMGIGKSESGSHLGVWTDVSLFNHDCRPK